MMDATKDEIAQVERKKALKQAYADFAQELHKKAQGKLTKRERKLVGATIWSLQEGYKKGR